MMSTTLLFGLILFAGFIGGELAKLVGLPKVTGYILAGIFLNPGSFGVIPVEFTDNTNVLTNMALSFITFSVGGSLLFPKLREMGKEILYITLLEAELAFLITAGGLLVFFYFMKNIQNCYKTKCTKRKKHKCSVRVVIYCFYSK